ncbi:hypothetical protein N2152v2_000578 [Parachlorella kessleri]
MLQKAGEECGSSGQYGEDGLVLPRDGGPQSGQEPEEAEEEEEIVKDQILVLDADSPMGEQVVLQLILARAKIKAVVRDGAAASAGFGPYIQAVQGLAGDSRMLRAALRGVRVVVCCGRMEPGLLPAAAAAGVQHLVLLSTVGAPRRGFGALFGGGEQAVLGDAGRQQAALSSGVPCTVVQVGSLLDQPGGSAELSLTVGSAPAGEICREDAARVLARVATGEPPAGRSLVLQAQQAQQSSSLSEGWESMLDSLMQQQTAA